MKRKYPNNKTLKKSYNIIFASQLYPVLESEIEYTHHRISIKMPWYVLYTKPRNEKKVALLLEQKGVIVYCPTQETIKQWSDRKKKVIEPVFRSYLFVHLGEYKKDSVYALTTPGAVRFLWWLGKPGVVKDEEIQQIKDFLNSYKDAIITTEIHEGEEVTIKEGVLKEKKGKVLRVQGNKVTLHLKSIGLNIVAHVSIQSIEKQ